MSASNFPSGVVGGLLATLLMSWLVTRAVPTAKVRRGHHVVEYRLPAKIAGWCVAAIGFFIAYAASQASANQRVIAAVVGVLSLLMSVYMLLEVHFVRVEFDDEFIYTFSPWRKRRVIPWSAVVGYSQSALNRWHILKTRGHGSVRLSDLLSGLGTMREKWESVLHPEPPNHALQPTTGRSDD